MSHSEHLRMKHDKRWTCTQPVSSSQKLVAIVTQDHLRSHKLPVISKKTPRDTSGESSKIFQVFHHPPWSPWLRQQLDSESKPRQGAFLHWTSPHLIGITVIHCGRCPDRMTIMTNLNPDGLQKVPPDKFRIGGFGSETTRPSGWHLAAGRWPGRKGLRHWRKIHVTTPPQQAQSHSSQP